MIEDFQNTVTDYYHDNQRTLPWRQPDADGTFDPYKIMVSEIMLQQTQVPRVIEKYKQFLEIFPTLSSLANAPLSDVLAAWQGLGYNRRGRYLREAAKVVVQDFGGVMPRTTKELTQLPGVGLNTASAILVYSYNQPLIFIETNIRTVYLYHFFAGQETVTDKEILNLVEETLNVNEPRDWYWALMDYGTFIKKQYGNQNVRSKHYAKQSTFKGSKREVRGMVLRLLTQESQSLMQLQLHIKDERLMNVLEDLMKDELIMKRADQFFIAH